MYVRMIVGMLVVCCVRFTCSQFLIYMLYPGYPRELAAGGQHPAGGGGGGAAALDVSGDGVGGR